MWSRLCRSCGRSTVLLAPHRSLSGSLAPENTLRRHLSRLWMKIHPDLFSQHPEEQAVNESSFKVLQEALREIESDDASYHRSSNPRSPPESLPFFYHASENGLKKTSVFLQKGRLDVALVDLFKALSLDPPPRHVLPEAPSSRARGDGGGPRRRGGSVSMSGLVRTARERGMDAMRARHDGSAAAASAESWARDDADLTRLVLQRSRGVSIEVGSAMPRRKGRVTGVERLSEALQKVPHANINGLRIVIDGGFDTHLHSPTGTLTLGVCAMDSRWVAALSSRAAEQAGADVRAVAALERAAARRLGVAHILFQGVGETGKGVVDNDSGQKERKHYRDLLAFLAGLEASGGAFLANAGNLSLVVVGQGVKPEEGVRNGVVAGIDVSEGILKVRVDSAHEEVLHALRTEGVGVAARYGLLQDRAAAEDALVWRVKRALRVDGLRRADGISDAEWSTALNDLIADAGRLGGVLDRSLVAVGRDSKVLDSGEVQIAWSFRTTLPL